VKINASYTTLRTSKFRAGQCEVLFRTGCNTYFYCVIWIAFDGGGEDTTMSIVTANFEFFSARYSRNNENLHPASVVCPASRKATENRENGGRSSTTASAASAALGWQASASVVIDIQPVRATTKLCTITGTDHVTVSGISGTTTINNLRSTN
jgi:hypothetical protein